MTRKIFSMHLMAITVFLTACVQVGLSTPQVASSSTSTLTPTKISPTTTLTISPTLTPTPEPTLTPSPVATRRIDIKNETAVEYVTSVLMGQPGQVVTHSLVITNLSSSSRTYDYLWARLNPTREMFLGWNYDVRLDEYSNLDYWFFDLGPQEHKEVYIPVVIPDYATNGMMSELSVKIPHYHQSPSELEPQFTTVVSTSTSIKQIGSIDMPTYDVAVQGDFIYIAAQTEGLYIFDISDPTKPVEIGVYNQQGVSVGNIIAKDQNLYAILCGDKGGLYVFDVSSPNSFKKIDFFEYSCYKQQKLEIVDNYIYYSEAGLNALDISDRFFPKQTKLLDTPVSDFYLTDKYLYIIPSNPDDPEHDYLKILDRFSLTEIGSFTLIHPPHAKPAKIEVSVINSLAYIRKEISWLGVGTENVSDWIVLDISDPTAPAEITNVTYKPKIVRDITFVDNYAYLADGKAGLRVLDISNSVAPVEVDAFGAGTPRYASGIEVSDGYMFLASGEGGLSILQYITP